MAEENKHPETAAADAEKAARKREEAIRKVEHMLAKDRVENAQKELDRISHLGRSHVRYTAVTEESDPVSGLLQYQKPEKPQEEMTAEELDAEQRKQEAIQKANLMLIRQRADTDRQRMNYSRQFVDMPKPKKAVEENKVDIAGFLSQYKLSPEAQARFAEIRYGAAKKGTVRPALAVRLGSILAPPMLLFTAWVLGQLGSTAVMKPVFIILACLSLFAAYYTNTWKLEYDSETGIVRYHSLFHGTNLYEMKELLGFMIQSHAEKPFPFFLPSLLDPRQYLVIRLPDHTINIPLLYSSAVLMTTVELEGYAGAGDFCRCLEQYQRDLYSKAGSEEKSAAPEKPAALEMPELSAPEKPVTLEKPKPAPQEKPVTLEKPKPAPQEKSVTPEKPKPAPDPVDLEKAREMFAKPAASALSMPERGSEFPDPTRSSAFPDPTQKPKSDVDVDALFNQVLRDHGRLK